MPLFICLQCVAIEYVPPLGLYCIAIIWQCKWHFRSFLQFSDSIELCSLFGSLERSHPYRLSNERFTAHSIGYLFLFGKKKKTIYPLLHNANWLSVVSVSNNIAAESGSKIAYWIQCVYEYVKKPFDDLSAIPVHTLTVHYIHTISNNTQVINN